MSDGVLDNRGPAGQGRTLCNNDSGEFEEDFSEGSDEEGEGGVASTHSLSDQLQLLTHTPLRSHQGSSPLQDPAELYSTVNKSTKKKFRSEGEDNTQKPVEKPRRSSLPSEEPSGKSLFIHDLTPPWKQMVSIFLGRL